jgi:hypothetical protein
VDQDDVDGTGLDVVGQMAQHIEFGAVPGVTALDEFDCGQADFVGQHALGDSPLAAPKDQDRPVDLRRLGDGAHRPRHHAAAGQRQIGLVAVRAHPGAHARGEHDAHCRRSGRRPHALTLAPVD